MNVVLDCQLQRHIWKSSGHPTLLSDWLLRFYNQRLLYCSNASQKYKEEKILKAILKLLSICMLTNTSKHIYFKLVVLMDGC